MHLLSRQADFGLPLRREDIQPGIVHHLHLSGRSRSYTLYSDRFLFLYRRSTGSEDSTASFHAGIECTGAQTSAFVWKYNFKESDSIRWGRAGVFPCRCRKIPSEKRLNIYRTYVVWCDASERTGAGRPLFRNNPPENRCFYA